jgi:hypothetical protein
MLPPMPSATQVLALKQSNHQVFVTVFSTDMNLLGDRQYSAGSIREGLQTFFQRCLQLKRIVPGLRVRIVCVKVSTSPYDEQQQQQQETNRMMPMSGMNSTTRYHDQNSFLLHSELAAASSVSSASSSASSGFNEGLPWMTGSKGENTMGQAPSSSSSSSSSSSCNGWIEIQHIHPTVMIYEEELKTLLGMIVPSICTNLELPSISGLQCEMKIELKAHSMRCLDCIQYMRSLETCSVTTRSGIDAKYIVGYGFEVTYPDEELFGNMTGLETTQR